MRLGFGYEQPEAGDPGLYIYDDVTGVIIASSFDEPPLDLRQSLVDALIVADPVEIERYRDGKCFIRWRDKILVDRHGNEYGKAPGYEDEGAEG